MILKATKKERKAALELYKETGNTRYLEIFNSGFTQVKTQEQLWDLEDSLTLKAVRIEEAG